MHKFLFERNLMAKVRMHINIVKNYKNNTVVSLPERLC